MAYLNVRERRIETKIAYVGPELAGKTTNLAQLQTDIARGHASDVQLQGDIRSLEWRPLRMTRFNDCDLAVKLVAPKGMISTERLDVVLEDADGVVIVVDAAPSAQDENRRAVQLVREALSRASTPCVPVVLQLNKSDVAGALGVDDVADVLAASNGETWPVITASAARGVGVVETLEMALANVIEAMKAKPPPAASAVTTKETNPLLGALRDILRETVSEHMAHVERVTADRIAATIGERLSRTEFAIEELKNALSTSSKELTRALGAQSKAISDLSSRIEEVQAGTFDLCTRGDLAGHDERLREDLSMRFRAEREHATAVVSALRRNVEAVAVEIKKQDPGQRLSQSAAELAALQRKVEAIGETLTPAAKTLGTMPQKLGALEIALQRELREAVMPKLARIEDSVQVMHVDAGESFGRVDRRAADIHEGLNELLDELKRRKKGWFS